MSRIGRMPITVPQGVTITVDADNTVTVKGTKGTLSQQIKPSISIKVDGGTVLVTRPNDEKENRALHGLSRTLIANMIDGVTKGFSKELDVVGVGYRVQKQGKQLIMNLGYSHQVIYDEIPGITIDAPTQNKIIVSGANKQVVGQVAAEIREKRPPEPYHGKGIKYSTEVIRRKEGKTGGKKK